MDPRVIAFGAQIKLWGWLPLLSAFCHCRSTGALRANFSSVSDLKQLVPVLVSRCHQITGVVWAPSLWLLHNALQLAEIVGGVEESD